MAVDSSRVKDLLMLREIMHDLSRPKKARQVAYKSYNRIMEQIKDRKLNSLRERLVKATYAEDKREMWKISSLIRDYLREDRLEEGTN